MLGTTHKHLGAMQILTRREIAAVSGGRMKIPGIQTTHVTTDTGFTWVHEVIQTPNGVIIHP
jgi:hypothetical protein